MKVDGGVGFDLDTVGAQAQELAQSNIPLVIAVSCNPSSFARDAKILMEGGYQLEEVIPVDQFLYSAHVELMARFKRQTS